MGLVLAFAELAVGVLMLTMGISGASAREVVSGHARDVYNADKAGAGGPANTTGPPGGQSIPIVSSTTGAIDPIQAKGLVVERIDQGRDFADQGGVIVSPEPGRVVATVPVGSGWEGGGAVVEQLADGTYTYFEEGVKPISALVGHAVAEGETIATLIPGFHSGVEAGYAAPTSAPGANYIGGGYETLAQKTTGYTEGQQTTAGKLFAGWLAKLGFGGQG